MTGHTRLVKVKSHSGLFINCRADMLAEQGRLNEELPPRSGPRTLDPLRLRVRSSLCDTQLLLPDDNVPDKLLVQQAVEGVELTATRT